MLLQSNLQAMAAEGRDQEVIRPVHAGGLQQHYKALQRAAELAEAQAATRSQAAAAEALPHLYASAAGATTTVPAAGHDMGVHASFQQLLWAQQWQLNAYAVQQQLQQQLQQQAQQQVQRQAQQQVQQQTTPSLPAEPITQRLAAVGRWRAKKAKIEGKLEVCSAGCMHAYV
jgi:hypothetical protein